MAEKRKLGKNDIVPFEEVIQCSFLDDEAGKVVGYIADASALLDLMEVLVSQGYEVSFRFDSVRQNHSVCIKGVYANCPNAGKWLYGNAVSLENAFDSAFYKHFEIYGQGEWKSRGPNTKLGVS